MISKSLYSRYAAHLWSNDTLSTTGDMLANFDYRLLTNTDKDLRKTALLCISMLIARPRLCILPPGKPFGSSKKIKTESKFVTLPFVERDSVLFYQPLGSCDEDCSLQLDVCRKLKSSNNTILEKCLIAYISKQKSSTMIRGCVPLTQLKESSYNLKSILDNIPDPMMDRLMLYVDPSWTSALQFRYLRIGGGEENLPSCSTSLSDISEKESSEIVEMSGPIEVKKLKILNVKGVSSEKVMRNPSDMEKAINKYKMINFSSVKIVLPLSSLQASRHELDFKTNTTQIASHLNNRTSSQRRVMINKKSASPSPTGKRNPNFKISILNSETQKVKKSGFLDSSPSTSKKAIVMTRGAPTQFNEYMLVKPDQNNRYFKPFTRARPNKI